MIIALRILAWVLVVLGVVIGGFLAFAPRTPVDTTITFDPDMLPDDLDAYLADAEATVPNLRADVERRIVWAGEAGAKTPLSVVYVHGFSASSGEIQPVPERVAQALGANLHYARLTGHGRDGDAMAEATVGAWLNDMAEALAIGRRIGDRVLVISTSTGGTLSAYAAQDPDMAKGVAGMVFVSPNFRINRSDAFMLTLPMVETWLPIVAGPTRSWEPMNEGHGTYWTNEYPTVAVAPMAALVAHVKGLDKGAAQTPGLFLYAEADQVVDAEATKQVAAEWGGPSQQAAFVMGPGDDPFAHVIAGDILSPGQTERAIEVITEWAQGL